MAMGLGNGKAYAAVTELPLDDNWGNTVYFTITDATNHYVEYVCPNENNVSWDGYTKPTGILDLPGTFDFMGVVYTATSIGNAAFNGCSGVYAVTIPSTVTHISSNAFNGTSLIQVNVYSNAIASDTYTSYYNFNTLFGGEVSGYTFGQGVTAIGPCALYSCDFLETVTIANTVTSIGYEAFQGCTYLESIVLPNSMTTIGDYAFSDCSHLTSVNIPPSVTSIGNSAFRNCNLLSRVNITDIAAWCAIDFGHNYGFYDSNPLSYAHHLYLNNTEITALTIPNTVTYIKAHAFYGCTAFTSVTIPASVTTIGIGAFTECTGLTRVTTPSLNAWLNIHFYSADANPLSYAHSLYVNNTKITTPNIPDGCQIIKPYAFSGADFTSVTVPSSLVNVGEGAFINCNSLTKVTVADLPSWCAIEFANAAANPLTYAHHLWTNGSMIASDGNWSTLQPLVPLIGSYALSGWTDLQNLTIEGYVDVVENSAFTGCTNLTSVTINDNLDAIASATYTSTNNLKTRFGSQVTSYTLGPHVTTIGDYAFYNCSGMTEVTFQGPVSSMGNDAFKGCTGLTRVNVNNLNAWCGIDFDYYDSNPLYYAHHLYHNNNLVTQLDNLDSPASIGAYAFSGCTDLTSVTIPSSVQSVGNHAFYGCTSLTTVTINSNAVASASYSYNSSSYSNDTFGSRFGNQVTSYILGPEVTAIGSKAFYNCTGMTEVTFQGPVSSMGENAFRGCTGLTRVNVSDLDAWCGIGFNDYNYNSNPLYYAHHLYCNGDLVTNLDNLSTATSIGAYAFYGCTDLTSVTIPSSVQSVWNHAFDGCTSLTSVTINSNAVASAEYGVSSNLNTRFGNQVTSCTFGPEVTAIGKYAFYYCTGMTEVTIPSSVQTIGADAFHGCTGFTSLTIPSSVQTIGADAFYGCSGITELYVGALTPPTIYSNTFTNVSRSIPVYVPVGTSASYRAAEYWSLFTNFVETVFPEQLEEIPYLQTFDGSTIPDKWRSCYGALQGENPPYTATLTPESGRWHFGAANGVFGGSSHAWVNIGGYYHYFWLVSPFLHLDANANMLSVDLAITRPSGNMVPMTPDAQDNTIIKVLISADYGATWTSLQSWKHEMGYTDLESLTPAGTTRSYNLSAYANQDILIGFYMECTDPDDASNRIHIDNFNVTSFDPTLPPTAVTVSEIAGHSAKVSWTPASSVQYKWDVIVAHVAFNPNTDNMEQLGYYDGVMEHVNGYRYKTITGLIPNYDSYKAWVRYNDGSVTSEWVASASFETDVICPMPSDITIVEHGLHSATITWTPGDENQTSWYIYVDNYHDMDGEELEEPSFTMNNLIPGENYDFYLLGYCGEDGESDPVNVDFTMSDYPSLTVNENTTSWDEYVVISGHETVNSCSRTQFIIPSNMLTPMQYSTIIDMKFYPKYYQGTQPWGQFAAFNVYVKEVEENNLGSYCGDSFYPWESMTTIYTGSLYIQNGVMTIQFPEGTPFSYHEGNLLIGIAQINNGYGEDCQISWYAAGNNPNSALYEPNGLDPECIHSLPKVTFTYETDPYLPPTNLVVTPTAPTEVTLTWTPREGQTATDVQLFNEGMVAMGTPWTWGDGNVFGLANLDPGTTYYVSIRGLYVVDGETHYSAWTNPVAFTTPDYCDAPDNLQVNEVGPFSATITWDNTAAYDEVEYRDANHMNVLLEEGFEGCEINTIPEGWITYPVDNGWKVPNNNTSAYNGIRYITTNNVSTGPTQKWLILPQFDRDGCLSLWANFNQNDTFGVYVSTTGTDIEDFVLVQECARTASGYQNFIIPISAQGDRYIAIMYQGPLMIRIDDVQYYEPVWTSLGPVEGGQYDFEGLTPGHTYQARVRSMCEVGDASYPGYWTDPVSFSTVNNIVFQDPVAKTASVYIGDTNGDGELSYAEAAAITNLGTIFQNQVGMQYFNELQYFIGLTAIGDNAFSGCDNLSAITLPPTITSIGYNAFGYTVNQQGQTIPCSSLHNIVIPPSVTTIGAFAFRRSGLTEVILPPSVTSIGDLAFGECNNLEYVYLPASVTSIDGNAFTGTSIETIEVNQENPVYDSRGGCNAIIQTDIDKLITGCKNTVIPDDVVSIGVSAFENATGLTTITLPSSVESIGEHAFANCSGLTTINAERPLPPTIYSNTFINMVHSNVTVNVPCGALSDYRNAEIWSGLSFNYVDPCNIVFADANVKAICVANWDTNGDGELSSAEAAAVTSLGTVFKDNTDITSFNELVYFTELSDIASHAFDGCTNLSSVMLPNNIIIIGNYAFRGCSSLVSVTLSDQLVRIMNNAFVNCSALSHIDIPSTVTYIGSSFGGCSSLSSIVIPASVNTIVVGAFNNCYSLQSIVVEPENTVYDSRNACNAIIKTETNELVIGCDNTEIPDDVVTIGANAFYGRSQMTTIVLPASVTSIGSTAFMGCGGVMEMHVNATTPPSLGNGVFGGSPAAVYPGIPVYVPCGSVADYQTYNNGAPWGGFNSIQGMGCENSRYLSAGWTWWVPYLDVTADELRNAFDEGTITGDILINSQSEGFLRRTNGEWGGTLSDFVVGKMYKIKTVSDGSFNYNGTRPTTVAVAIEPGYNWFGIQGNSTAIATLITPANGDKILKDDGTWVTFDGTYWIFDNGAYSSSFVIQPGIGYIYYNATNETKTMTFSY